MIHTTVIPKDRVVTLSFTVPEDYVGEEVEIIAFVKNESEFSTLFPALSGDPLSNKAFKEWIAHAESLPTISLEEAKSRWINKRDLLQKLTK